MKKVMVIAGEASGDLLGAELIQKIQQQSKDIRFVGIAGKEMQKTGMPSLFDMSELSIMGITEVLPHIPHMIKRINETVTFAEKEKVDLLITIDSPDFCLRVAKKVKKQLNIPCIHYVSPSIWAWRRKRAQKMATFLDHVLLLFPFEERFYKPYNLPTSFVGHPVTKRDIPLAKGSVKEPTIALLPGSRKKVIQKMLPLMLETFEKLKKDIPHLKAIIPLADSNHINFITEDLPPDVTMVTKNRFQELAKCRAAIATSGTSNLELAVSGLPVVVTYAVSPFTFLLTKILAYIPYASPINWVLNEGYPQKEGIPECLQENATAENIYHHIHPLITDSPEREEQLKLLEKTVGKLTYHANEKQPDIAKIVLKYIS
jgi:lipid-A-disaccharide synthase